MTEKREQFVERRLSVLRRDPHQRPDGDRTVVLSKTRLINELRAAYCAGELAGWTKGRRFSDTAKANNA